MKHWDPDRYNKERLDRQYYAAPAEQVIAQDRSSRVFDTAPSWPCPGEQAVSEDIYYPAALKCAQVEAENARSDSARWRKTSVAMAKHAQIYQVLALLGWVAVVVMGVWG